MTPITIPAPVWKNSSTQTNLQGAVDRNAMMRWKSSWRVLACVATRNRNVVFVICSDVFSTLGCIYDTIMWHFYLKITASRHVDGAVCCYRVSSFSVTVGSQRYTHVYFSAKHYHDVRRFVCGQHLHDVWQTDTYVGFLFTMGVALINFYIMLLYCM